MLQLTPETIVGGLSILGMTVLAMKKLGWITIGKPVERRDCAKKCSEHEHVVANAKIVAAEAKSTTDGIRDDIKELQNQIRTLTDDAKQREQKIQDEFRLLRQSLGELTGYVKAIHEQR